MEIKAEMAATVVAITCADGQPVEVGSELLILESMKMEMPVHAHKSGSVLSVCVAEGDVVQKGDTLVILA